MRESYKMLAEYSHLLPQQAQELVRIIGVRLTLELVKGLGGCTFPVPHRFSLETQQAQSRFSLLAGVIGEEAAQELCRQYGGTSVYIPNCNKVLSRIRNIVMIKEYDARRAKGESAASVVFDLTIRYRLADRVIWDIVNKQTVAGILGECGIKEQPARQGKLI